MFILHSSNKTENLAGHLAAVLEHAPLESPFSSELFLIQSLGMERWLCQQLSQRFGVWSNYRFLFPDYFFNFIAAQLGIGVDDSAFERSNLLWRFESELRNLKGDEFQPLQAYLAGKNQALKRFQLARQLAHVYDQYQIIRPDLLDSWQQGKLAYGSSTELWQKSLWLQLTEKIGSQHRGTLWLETIKKLNNAKVGSFKKQIPERLCIFGINNLPPLFLTYLQSLANHCQIHLFLLNPAQTYWADVATKRHLINTKQPSDHPLLASLGQQGREFQQMLLELTQFDFEPESFSAAVAPNVLQRLQNDILDNSLSPDALNKDHSLSIHACHSRKREVEILKDLLLLALDTDHFLELRDIVVMAPDIQVYEPFITAVFHDIQHAIADRSLRLDNKPLDAFIRFLELSQSRLGWQSVMDVLELEAVYPAFGLSETDLDLIKYWVQDTNVRWGESGQHKTELGLPPLAENTWQAALDRLLMGYAVGDNTQFVLGILPYRNIEGSSASALGGLHDFLNLLFQARADFQHARNLKSWGDLFSRYAKQLLGDDASLERQPLNELFFELNVTLSGFHQDPVDVSVIMQWLEASVTERKSSNGFLRGQLTFCSMLPMRSIPFKVIAVMGLNEGEFPKIDRAPTFDLISQHFRKGDRSRRRDDRYQFLEILLSARQQLILSYVGQSQSSNDKIPPSVVISELLVVLTDYYQLADVVIHHPLQAFSPRYFNGEAGLSSFSQSDCATARALSGENNPQQSWWIGEIPVEREEIIALADLFHYFSHPQRYFLRRHFGIRANPLQAEIEEREAFGLDQLANYNLNQEWTDALLKGASFSSNLLRARGCWLAGMVGELEFEQRQLELLEFAECIKVLGVGPLLPAQQIDLQIGNHRLVGRLPHYYQQHNLLYRYAALKGKDFIQAWLTHLICNANEAKATHLVSSDFLLSFEPDYCPTDDLAQWLEIYLDGRKRPDAFFTEAAFAYMQQSYVSQNNNRSKTSPLSAARKVLLNTFESDYELELKQLFGNIHNIEMLLTDSHAELYNALLVPVWEKVVGN